MTTETIPFLDLVQPHLELEKELTDAFSIVLQSGRFVGGPMVEQFEKQFAAFCGAQHAVAVSSGTDALRFALIAAGIMPEDVVITVPNTFIATTEAISQAGASPMFADIDQKTFTMSPGKLEAFFEKHCRYDKTHGKMVLQTTGKPVTAIIPVHLYGQTAEMNSIRAIAETYNCVVIEDACQAHGAEYHDKKTNQWRKAGVLGAAAAFSFYPGKNIGALGEGGAVTTNDPEIAKTVSMLRDHGQARKYHHDMEGYNGRLDAIQAAMLSVKLQYLEQWNEDRRKCARYYDYLFNTMDGVVTPYEPPWARSVYHLYVVRVGQRDDLQKFLSSRGIGTGLHYPVPLHLQKAYEKLKYKKGDFPISEKAACEILSLPMFPHLTEEQQEHVVESIADFMENPNLSGDVVQPSAMTA